MFSDTGQPPVKFPGVVIIDTREQLPFAFAGLFADAHQKHAPLVVKTVRGTLTSGDYSLEGYESRVAIERKSMTDLFGTIGQDRQRFERELCRLAAYDFSAVVVEADWRTIIESPPIRSQLPVKIIHRSILAWQQRYPSTHWWMCPDRTFAEITTFRILERYWKDVTSGARVQYGTSFATWKGKTAAAAVLQQEEYEEAGVTAAVTGQSLSPPKPGDVI